MHRKPGNAKPKKPKKPYKDFPLYAHASGRWAKTINGKIHYFGRWSDEWRVVLERYQHQKDDLYAGRSPRPVSHNGHTLSDLCNTFLTDKQALVKCGELAPRTWDDYLRSSQQLIEHFGRQRLIEDVLPEDFASLRAKLAKGRNPNTLANEIGRIRAIFNYAGPRGLYWLKTPIHFGPMFKKPSRRTMRIHRASIPSQEIPASVIRAVTGAASDQLAAMVLLGINCGMGNTDCALLLPNHIDWKGGWLRYPRPKTGVDRMAKLWPETMIALEQIEWEDAMKPLFRTKYDNSWEGRSKANPISAEFKKVLDQLNLYEKGRSFYSLRRTFQTVAEECGDFPAISLVMGHDDGSMASRYRQRISEQRLERVAETVRAWLLAE